MKNIFKKYGKYALFALGVLIISVFFLLRNGKNKLESYTAKLANIEQSVRLSGKIENTDKADLGFAVSGRLAKVFVENNQSVNQGAVLAQLEIGDLLADLQIKQANLKTSNVDLESAKDGVEKVTRQEDTKVTNAYRSLLSEGLALSPEDEDADFDIPIISGIYDGPEGQYKIIIDKKRSTDLDSWLNTFNLEKSSNRINKNSTTPLGTRGLYMSFSSNDLSDYTETLWYLDIPNKSSSLYLSNLNAYNEAKDARDLAIKDAQAEYDKLLSRGDSGFSVAQAEINKIQAEIRKSTIYAPFSGKVTNIEKEVGENATVGETIITVLGENKLKVVLQVSELDVSKLVVGSSITISLDAIPGEEFVGVLQTVNSKETEIDGVPVYEAFVELASDPRIKNGMNANGHIVIAHRDNVIAIPAYLIKKVGTVNFVTVAEADGTLVEKEITLGLMGTDSMVEVISGLTEGDKVFRNANAK
ncbi:MAG: efflux RND transporter periplasmic adaptor subunit [Patescibacteria group bacterium]